MDQDSPLDRMISALYVEQQAHDKTWFSYAAQRKKIFDIASQLRIHDSELSDEECIELAESFVDTFFKMKVNRETRG